MCTMQYFHAFYVALVNVLLLARMCIVLATNCSNTMTTRALMSTTQIRQRERERDLIVRPWVLHDLVVSLYTCIQAFLGGLFI